jgi:hypothetical protein
VVAASGAQTSCMLWLYCNCLYVKVELRTKSECPVRLDIGIEAVKGYYVAHIAESIRVHRL